MCKSCLFKKQKQKHPIFIIACSPCPQMLLDQMNQSCSPGKTNELFSFKSDPDPQELHHMPFLKRWTGLTGTHRMNCKNGTANGSKYPSQFFCMDIAKQVVIPCIYTQKISHCML